MSGYWLDIVIIYGVSLHYATREWDVCTSRVTSSSLCLLMSFQFLPRLLSSLSRHVNTTNTKFPPPSRISGPQRDTVLVNSTLFAAPRSLVPECHADLPCRGVLHPAVTSMKHCTICPPANGDVLCCVTSICVQHTRSVTVHCRSLSFI